MFNFFITKDLNPENILTREEEAEVVKAIQNAERKTSGEIRVHLDEEVSENHQQRAQEIFKKMGMYNTKERNGILFHVCTKAKVFVIYGDQGIHEKVGDYFWEKVKNEVIESFKEAKYSEGLIGGIEKAGNILQKYFPFDSQTDINELPDEISRS